MKELIDKAAVVAEIEKRVTEGEKVSKEVPSSAIMGLVQAYKNTLSFIDTLEVKEVDCEREIGMYTTKELLRKRNKATNVFHLTQGDIDRIAEHFFELGLKVAQK